MQKIIHQEILIYHHFTPKYVDICATVNSLFDALWKKPSGYELSVLGQFYHFFGLIFGNHYYLESVTRARRDYKRILQLKQVLDFIEHNYASPLTLQQLSASVSMSPKYFCRFFSEMTHQTPMDYLNHQRIEQACYQLSTTDDSITEIAYRNGFNDLSYFIRTFKKYNGDHSREIIKKHSIEKEALKTHTCANLQSSFLLSHLKQLLLQYLIQYR